ncbi:hypothetical protein SAPIO_CDS8703 [Scedosporium apiospermum]|uniref:Cytochrome b5 heme-binding domain-containing protein n=1 Tax=Pseudallescheria apiosperma TaxID=563466 RepID=A0A084G088_PSEDA|nr:uncharacterized protein SAPIO_CDS8703 [Scedosporium apiospermum]KEZ40750.1 hypothetical protein SAPIO_CDS8703 [Scedosporium apiospermum]
MAKLKELTPEEVARHCTEVDVFIIIQGNVYDCTEFLKDHPGGEDIIMEVAGEDATEAFDDVGHSDEAREMLPKMIVGKIKQ